MAKTKKDGSCCKSSCCVCCCKGGGASEDKCDGAYMPNASHPNTGNNQTGNVACQDKSQKGNKCRKCVRCCKKFTMFLFSNIGLCALVVAYSVLGGFIFRELEGPHEIQQRHAVNSKRKAHVEKLWNLTLAANIFHEQNWSIIADQILSDFQAEIFQATKLDGWDGQDGDTEVDQQWTFPGSLLYAVTVITTIGYGHIAPKTDYGRLVTMFYALFGIPLMLLCLANLGSTFGNCFRLIYKHTCKTCMWLCCPPQVRRERESSRERDFYKTNVPSEQKDLLNVKNVKNRPKSDPGVTIIIEDVQNNPVKKEEPIRVPIFVSLMIIVLYIFGGAVLFSYWEDWSYLVGSYFCFVTLSTIGFGDFVPGSSTYSFSNQEKLIICCFYLLFGLSVIAMCFNLMQEEVRAKCVWLGQKLGVIDKR